MDTTRQQLSTSITTSSQHVCTPGIPEMAAMAGRICQWWNKVCKEWPTMGDIYHTDFPNLPCSIWTQINKYKWPTRPRRICKVLTNRWQQWYHICRWQHLRLHTNHKAAHQCPQTSMSRGFHRRIKTQTYSSRGWRLQSHTLLNGKLNGRVGIHYISSQICKSSKVSLSFPSFQKKKSIQNLRKNNKFTSWDIVFGHCVYAWFKTSNICINTSLGQTCRGTRTNRQIKLKKSHNIFECINKNKTG